MVEYDPKPIAEIELSALFAGATETLAFPAGHPGSAVKAVSAHVITGATSGDPVFLTAWASDESNSQLTARLDTVAGGDLAGAVVKLRVEWLDQAAQDGSSIS